MSTSNSTLSSQYQVTVPAWVRKKLNLNKECELVWIEFRPGEISVVSQPKADPENSLLNLCGIIEDDSWDSLEEIKKMKAHDKKLEDRLL